MRRRCWTLVCLCTSSRRAAATIPQCCSRVTPSALRRPTKVRPRRSALYRKACLENELGPSWVQNDQGCRIVLDRVMAKTLMHKAWSRSSAGQSSGFLNRRSEVRVFPGPPNNSKSDNLRLIERRPEQAVGDRADAKRRGVKASEKLSFFTWAAGAKQTRDLYSAAPSIGDRSLRLGSRSARRIGSLAAVWHRSQSARTPICRVGSERTRTCSHGVN